MAKSPNPKIQIFQGLPTKPASSDLVGFLRLVSSSPSGTNWLASVFSRTSSSSSSSCLSFVSCEYVYYKQNKIWRKSLTLNLKRQIERVVRRATFPIRTSFASPLKIWSVSARTKPGGTWPTGVTVGGGGHDGSREVTEVTL